MHTHDRTLLAKLGFADLDRKDSRHDLACLYVSQTSVLERIVASVTAMVPFPGRVDLSVKPFTPEFHISKGEGQYATTIGFADLIINLNVFEKLDVDSADYWSRPGQIGVEVKISDPGVGDVLRQINLYRQYSVIRNWVLVTTYPLLFHHIEMLRKERVFHFELGHNFNDWITRQEQEGKSAQNTKSGDYL